MQNDFEAMATAITRQIDKDERLILIRDSDFRRKRQEYRMKTFNAFDLERMKKIARQNGYEISSWRVAGEWATDELLVNIYFLEIPVKNGEGEL